MSFVAKFDEIFALKKGRKSIRRRGITASD
jgi:hypothetical protein